MATVFNYAAMIALSLLAVFAFAFPVSAQTGAGLDTGVSLDLGTSDTDANVDARATTSASTDAQDDSAAEPANSNESFTVLRSSLGADVTTAPASADAVMTDADLSAYASAMMRADDRIEAVAFNDENVEVRYGAPGRLFGIFPVTMTVRAEVASDGSVAVSYPWYRFLVASDGGADIESELSSRIDAATLSAGGSLSVAAKARLIDEIRAALPDASASAGASASGEAR